MNQNSVLIHASLNMKNLLDKSSLIMEKIEDKFILELMLTKLIMSKQVNNIYIVCSDQKCDDEIEILVLEIKKQNPILDIIRINNDKPYAMCDLNTIWRPECKIPANGFWTFECLEDYSKSLQLDRVMIFTADNNFLINSEFIDKIFVDYDRDEHIFRLGNPTSEILLFSVEAVSRHSVIYKNEVAKKFNYEKRKLQDSLSLLTKKENYTEQEIKSIKELKEKGLEKQYLQLNRLHEIISNKHGKLGIKPIAIANELSDYKYCFSGCYNKEILEIYKKIQGFELQDIFDIEKQIYEYSIPIFPGYLEIELTNRCDLTCDDCPQTRLKREKIDLSFNDFKNIIDKTAQNTPFLNLSGYGEPVLYKDLVKCVSYAKEAGFFRVSLETNGINLTENLLKELSDAGLDIIILNLDALDKYSKNIEFDKKNSSVIIKRVLEMQNKKGTKTPRLFLQITAKNNNFDEIQEYFTHWEHMVSGILVQSFNDFCKEFEHKNMIDFMPLQISEEQEKCLKTKLSMFIMSNNKISLCRQFYDEFSNEENIFDVWRQNINKGKKQDKCKDCNQFYFSDISAYNFNKNELIKYLDFNLDNIKQKEIDKGTKLYFDKEYEKALDTWENVLKIDPANEFIHEKLDEIIKKEE